MYHSREIRWFFEGSIPQAVRQWFDASETVTSEPERTDEYLRLPDCTTVGVKFREGRFEIKAQTSAPVAATYSDTVAGFRDAWVKWSSGEGVQRERFMQDAGEWISVTKARRLRLYSLASGTPQEVAVSDGLPGRGCQVELSAVRARFAGEPAAPWWSLSFEAFGAGETMLDDLDRAIGAFFSDPPPLSLTADSSMSYPAWLASRRVIPDSVNG